MRARAVLVILVIEGALACSPAFPHVPERRAEAAPVAMQAEVAEEAGAPPWQDATAEPSAARAEAPGRAVPARPRLARAEDRRPAAAKGAVAAEKAEGRAVGDAAAEARAPLLIYTAQLTMAIFEVAPALKATLALADEMGGFLARQSNDAITIRVPVARFQEALGRIEKLGDVTHRNIEAQDVTQEYFDLEVRLQSARAVRERLEHLLARATKVEESIAIERELERVVGEIERLEGRLKFLADRAQFSTITVRFQARPKEVVAKGTFKLPFPWLDALGLGRLLDLR